MKTRTRLSALLLALCLIMSMIVPAVYAEPLATQTYSLGSGSTLYEFSKDENNASPSNGYTWAQANTAFSFPSADAPVWTYLNQSHTGRRVQVNTSNLTVQFNASDLSNNRGGSFVAIQLHGVKTGTYEMNFEVKPFSNGGYTQVYLVSRADYDAAVSGITFSTANAHVSAANHTAIYNALTEKALNNVTNGKLDSHSSADAVQNLGAVTIEESGEYVLVFASAAVSGGSGVYLSVNSLTMTSVPTASVTVDGVTTYCYTTADTITAIEETASGTVQLLANIKTDDDIAIKSGLTLDLNGYDLTAKSVTTFSGTNIVDTNTANKGILSVTSVETTKLVLQTTNSQLPLYDSANGGYRFFAVTIETSETFAPTEVVKVEGTETVSSAKFWFRVKFDNSTAYDLIATGGSGFLIRPYVNWNEIDSGKNFAADSTFCTEWAVAAGRNPNIAINLKVTGLEAATNFRLIHRVGIQLDNGTRVQIQGTTYVVN